MDIKLKPGVTIEALQSDLQQRFPEYTYAQRKTIYGPMIIVKKTNFVGTGVRLVKNNTQAKVFHAFPSLWVQALFGGLLVYAFVYSGMKKMQVQVGNYIQEKYGQLS